MSQQKGKSPKLPPIPDEMRAWSTALADEVSSWPQAEGRSFFGLTALYRGERMFGALPRTRALEPANAVAFKLEAAGPKLRASLKEDGRISAFGKNKKRWFLFTLSSGAELHVALEWLLMAYEAAGKRRQKSG